MFIGEGPGYHEDRQGRPFVGPAGQLLDGLLASIGAHRGAVFIANMVKCRPPQNRDPEPAEIAACAKYLDRQIELVNPRLIVTLGRFSLSRFFPGESVTRARGQPRRAQDGRLIFPVLHPAAALRRPELRKTMVDDFRAIAQILESPPEPAPAAPSAAARGRANRGSVHRPRAATAPGWRSPGNAAGRPPGPGRARPAAAFAAITISGIPK